jgi:hypothetical protein
MDNPRGNGMQINLCKGCHDYLHLIIPSIYWDILTPIQKEEAIRKIISTSKKYGGLK